MKQKGFAPILIVLIFSALFVFAGAGYWYSGEIKKTAQEENNIQSNDKNKGNPTRVIDALYPDFSKNEVLIGKSHNIFVGKVLREAGRIEVGGTNGDLGVPYTQFEVQVLLNIKGNLSGSVLVDRMGDGNTIFSDGGAKLNIGSTYLMATRQISTKDSYILIEESHGWKLLNENNELNESELINLAEKDQRVNELRIAYPNEILPPGAVKNNTALNSFISLPQAEQDRLKAEAEQLKAEMQK